MLRKNKDEKLSFGRIKKLRVRGVKLQFPEGQHYKNKKQLREITEVKCHLQRETQFSYE